MDPGCEFRLYMWTLSGLTEDIKELLNETISLVEIGEPPAREQQAIREPPDVERTECVGAIDAVIALHTDLQEIRHMIWHISTAVVEHNKCVKYQRTACPAPECRWKNNTCQTQLLKSVESN